MKINVWYWKAADADYSAASGFPCFIEYTYKDGRNWHLYGLPNLEYPGLIKVQTYNSFTDNLKFYHRKEDMVTEVNLAMKHILG